MWSRALAWVRARRFEIVLCGEGLAAWLFALFFARWWGDRSFGALICGGSIFLILAGLRLLTVSQSVPPPPSVHSDWHFNWGLTALPALIVTIIALVLRKPLASGVGVTLQLRLPGLPSANSILLSAVFVALVFLFRALTGSLSRGETVSVESHWGGLGGSIAGWRLSAPLVYLLGIVVLVAISTAIAWHSFSTATPMATADQKQVSSTPSAEAKPGMKP